MNLISTNFVFLLRFLQIKMSAPALKDLPRVDVTLKSQLEGFNPEKLKEVDTQEKVVLPTVEGELRFPFKATI